VPNGLAGGGSVHGLIPTAGEMGPELAHRIPEVNRDVVSYRLKARLRGGASLPQTVRERCSRHIASQAAGVQWNHCTPTRAGTIPICLSA